MLKLNIFLNRSMGRNNEGSRVKQTGECLLTTLVSSRKLTLGGKTTDNDQIQAEFQKRNLSSERSPSVQQRQNHP